MVNTNSVKCSSGWCKGVILHKETSQFLCLPRASISTRNRKTPQRFPLLKAKALSRDVSSHPVILFDIMVPLLKHEEIGMLCFDRIQLCVIRSITLFQSSLICHSLSSWKWSIQTSGFCLRKERWMNQIWCRISFWINDLLIMRHSLTWWCDYQLGCACSDRSLCSVRITSTLTACKSCWAHSSQPELRCMPSQTIQNGTGEKTPWVVISSYEYHRKIEDKLGLGQYLQWTFLSCCGPMKVIVTNEQNRRLFCVQGLRKPDSRAFQIVLETLECSSDDILLIDDRKHNILAGDDVGIDGIHFKDAASLQTELRQRGWNI